MPAGMDPQGGLAGTPFIAHVNVLAEPVETCEVWTAYDSHHGGPGCETLLRILKPSVDIFRIVCASTAPDSSK